MQDVNSTLPAEFTHLLRVHTACQLGDAFHLRDPSLFLGLCHISYPTVSLRGPRSQTDPEQQSRVAFNVGYKSRKNS